VKCPTFSAITCDRELRLGGHKEKNYKY